MARKKINWKTGDIFLIPLKDNSYSIGQIVAPETETLHSVFCTFYNLRYKNDSEIKEINLSNDKLISAIFVVQTYLDNGKWNVLYNKEVYNETVFKNDLNKFRNNDFIGVGIKEPGIIEEFLSAFFKLCPWDDWADPNYLDSLLISPDKKPANIVLKKK